MALGAPRPCMVACHQGGVLPSTASMAGVGVVCSAAGRKVRPRSVQTVSSSGRAGVTNVAMGSPVPE